MPPRRSAEWFVTVGRMVVMAVIVAVVVRRVVGDGSGMAGRIGVVLVCAHRLVSNLRRPFCHPARRLDSAP